MLTRLPCKPYCRMLTGVVSSSWHQDRGQPGVSVLLPLSSCPPPSVLPSCPPTPPQEIAPSGSLAIGHKNWRHSASGGVRLTRNSFHRLLWVIGSTASCHPQLFTWETWHRDPPSPLPDSLGRFKVLGLICLDLIIKRYVMNTVFLRAIKDCSQRG